MGKSKPLPFLMGPNFAFVPAISWLKQVLGDVQNLGDKLRINSDLLAEYFHFKAMDNWTHN